MIVNGYVIILSDQNPRENVTKTRSGAERPRVFRSHFPYDFCQTSIYMYDQE